ncbi:MAG: aminotransferase class I/II-fold pyridoxal phosphate-dependent enzyme, partial [Thermodesulfobacteriota bacterium]
TALANIGFFKEVIDLAQKNNILICHDAAYTEVAFNGCKPISFLEVEGAMDVGVEFQSLSKTFSMTGWRIGFAAGNKRAVAGLGKVKTNIDSGVFQAVQVAATAALNNYELGLEERINVYKERVDLFCKSLDEAGIKHQKPEATFYIWFEVPSGITSAEFCSRLLEDAGIIVTPGNGFGEYGEGYARASVTFETERILKAADRIKEFKF